MSVEHVVHWASEAEVSDTDGRVAAIGAPLEGLSGKAEPRMAGVPTYTVVREVGPGPRP